MAFKTLLNKPRSEEELLAQVSAEIQQHYLIYQTHRYFLKLEKVSAQKSQIIWVKAIAGKHEFSDFIFDTEFQRSCILIRFENNKYVTCCMGFHWDNQVEITIDAVSAGRPQAITWNCEEKKMYKKNIFKGLQQISCELKSAKGRKAV